MMKKTKTARGLLLLFLVSLIGIILPTAVGASADDRKQVRVGYYENEVFQEGAQDDAVKTGYAYEYYQKLSEYTGWQYEYVYGTFSDLYQMLLDGKIDFLAGLAWREDREELIGYPDAAMGNETYNLVKHGQDDSITINPETLNGRSIGVLDSAMAYALEDFLQRNHLQAQVVLFEDYEPLFQAFDNNEVDVLVAEGDGAYGRANAELLYSFGASDYYLCVSKSKPELLAELNTAQMQLSINEPNYISFLRSKYYPVSISSRAFSAAEKQWLAEHDALRIGYLNHYLPYSGTNEAGEVTGLIRDIIPKMLDGLGIDDLSVSYVGFDRYDDMIASLTSDEIDAAFPVGGGLFYSEESGIFQSTPVVSAATELVYKGEYTEETVSYFAVNENNRMQYYFVKTYYPEAEITFFPSIEDCLEAVSDGRVGCTTLNGLRANDILKNSRYRGLSLLQTTYNDDRCFGVRSGNSGLLMLLNRGINVLGTDYAQNLAFQYTDQLYSYSFTDFDRNYMPLFVGIIPGVAAVIILLLIRDKQRSKREILNQENARKELEKANIELAESQEAKQHELEERLALQEELLEQQFRREQQDKMITALASDYRCVYHVDLDHNDGVCYRADPDDHEQTPEGVHFPYYERFSWYADNSVAPAYRDDFLRFIHPDHVREALADNQIIAYRYLAQRKGKEYYEMIRMAGVRHAEDREDHIVHAVGMGLTVIDEEMRETMAKNQTLVEALAAAEQANRAKTAFLSNMSHEIRTPMNAIIGLDSLALQNESLPEETREYLEQINGSAHHLLGLINDILDMSRIESGRLSIRNEEFSFREILEQINTMVTSQCSEKGLHYECRVIGSVSDTYIGDDMKLKQVLINILSNAIKFTDAPGSVLLSVECTAVYKDHSALKFCVKDTGIGMDKEFLPKIFDAFSQEDSGRSSKYGSTGLGMAITKNIVELMNGRITVESEKGVGTEFTVAIALKNSPRQGTAEQAEKNPAHPDGEKKRADLNGRRILLAEDVLINAEIIKQILMMRGSEIEHAENGKIALEMFEKSGFRYYDAILMDIRMPEMDGLEATAQIRKLKRPDAKTVPIIAMTANAFDEDVQRSLQVGMNAHLSKPVEPERLYQTLEELIWEADDAGQGTDPEKPEG